MGVENLQSSQKKNTSHAESLTAIQVQLVYHAEGQHQDDQIDHALANARGQPEGVVVDAVFGIGVAVQPRPFQRNAVQTVSQRGREPEGYDYP